MASSSSSPDGIVPLLDNSQFLHGRIDPGLDSSLDLVDSVGVEGTAQSGAQLCLWNDSKDNHDSSLASIEHSSAVATVEDPAINTTGRDHLKSLPSELIDHILTFLEPFDLVAVQKSAKYLSPHANEDIAWQRFVQANVPGLTLQNPAPFASFRELYIAHDPYWFLTKHKIWFSDYFLTGKIIIVRYNPRRGCIEGYRMVAERHPPSFDTWEADEEVLIHSFTPHTKLHFDQPVVYLGSPPEPPQGRFVNRDDSNRFQAEIPMLKKTRDNNGIFANFLLTRPVEERPNMQMWPPQTIPSRHRVRNASQQGFVGEGHKPRRRAEISDLSFRIRHWMEILGRQNPPGVHLGEEVYTYSTLDPKLYTPTEEKPWRGIWVGDYSGHGCEFLLMNQPDDKEPFDESSFIQREDETSEEFQKRKKDERIYRGSIEAIKLTGDPNVPRGEYTFIADDISESGYIRTANETRFQGARIVRSRGHIAATMFRNDKYIESQLIMISHNRLAQYWVGFGHISFYERVDIESFLSPENDPVVEVLGTSPTSADSG